MKRILLAVLVALLLPMLAAGVTIAWDANPVEEGVTHYNIGMSGGSPANTVWNAADTYQKVFDTTQTVFTLPPGTMPPCTLYYLAVQAENGVGGKSDWADKTSAGEYLTVDLTGPDACRPSTPKNVGPVQLTINPDGSVSIQIL